MVKTLKCSIKHIVLSDGTILRPNWTEMSGAWIDSEGNFWKVRKLDAVRKEDLSGTIAEKMFCFDKDGEVLYER